jgi:hypothetical protein
MSPCDQRGSDWPAGLGFFMASGFKPDQTVHAEPRRRGDEAPGAAARFEHRLVLPPHYRDANCASCAFCGPNYSADYGEWADTKPPADECATFGADVTTEVNDVRHRSRVRWGGLSRKPGSQESSSRRGPASRTVLNQVARPASRNLVPFLRSFGSVFSKTSCPP